MFERVEPVEIFDQFILFPVTQLNDVTFREFFGVILYRLVYPFGFHPIKFGHISIQKYALFTDGQHLLFIYSAYISHAPRFGLPIDSMTLPTILK